MDFFVGCDRLVWFDPFDGGNALLSGYWAELFRRNPWMFMVWISANMSIAGGAFTLLGIGFSHLFKEIFHLLWGLFILHRAYSHFINFAKTALYSVWSLRIQRALVYLSDHLFSTVYDRESWYARYPIFSSSHIGHAHRLGDREWGHMFSYLVDVLQGQKRVDLMFALYTATLRKKAFGKNTMIILTILNVLFVFS